MEALPYLAMVCIWGWSQSLPLVGGVSTSPTGSAKVHMFMFWDSLMATCGSVLVELWVWG